MYYQAGDMAIYTPGKHPGEYLLPASELCKYQDLPKSVKDQMYGCQYYDYYGDMSGIYLKKFTTQSCRILKRLTICQRRKLWPDPSLILTSRRLSSLSMPRRPLSNNLSSNRTSIPPLAVFLLLISQKTSLRFLAFSILNARNKMIY